MLAVEPSNARARLYLGIVHERRGKVAEAIQAYRAAMECKAPAFAAAVYLARRLVKKSPDEAAAFARHAAEVYPQSSRARHILMTALIAAGKAGEAETVGKRLLRRDPTNPVTARLLAKAAAKAGHDGDAQAFDSQARRLVAGDTQAAKALESDLRWLGGDGSAVQP